ncbi:unnamed protein product, partial [Didymodactylos carnosus]
MYLHSSHRMFELLSCGKTISNSSLKYAVKSIGILLLNTNTNIIGKSLRLYECQTFTDIDECIIYVKSQTKQLFLIISNMSDKVILQLQKLSQIKFIYLYDCKLEKNTKNIRGNISDLNELKKLLIEDIKQYSQELLYITSITVFNATKTKVKNKNQVHFIWFQFIINMLLSLTPKDGAEEEMILEYCFQSDKSELSKDTDIEWYINNSSIYHLMNQAFQTDNIEFLFKIQYFIINLHNDINKHYHPLSTYQNRLLLYRGQLMIANDLQNLEENIGGFISINSFLYTTRSLNTARQYAGNGSDQSNLKSVLFEIEIDPNTTTKSFANLNRKDSNEILF